MSHPPTKLAVVSSSRPRVLHEDDPTNGNGAMQNGVADRLPMIDGKVVDPNEISAEVEKMSTSEAIGWALETFHPRMRFAVSFQKTSSVIIDLAHQINPEAKFFYLDTDVLFDETYETRDKLSEHYGIDFERFGGITLDEQAALHGDKLWERQPDACCRIRKVEVMHEALSDIDCWVSGIRREDSASRAGAAKFGWDKRFGLWKLNPLADWDDAQIWNHIRENNVPYNPLHDQGYPSIGCVPCTQRPTDGDDRSGRWAGSDRSECGING